MLRFRYTTYMGEHHPAEKKVVVEFSPVDLDLTPVQADKLRKLAGPRWNPEKDIIKMSSEKFEHQAQNKRYLSDLVDTLVATAKVSTQAGRTRGAAGLINHHRTPRTLSRIFLWIPDITSPRRSPGSPWSGA